MEPIVDVPAAVAAMPAAAPASLSKRVSEATDALHEHLHTLTSAANPYASRERFGRLSAVQYAFQREMQPLYEDDSLQQLLPGLPERFRRAAAEADLADLGMPVPGIGADLSPRDIPAAIGWIYVSEGSTLGAAMQLKHAKEELGLSETFGARYLAAAPEGRGKRWKVFIDAVDELKLTHDEEARVIAGAEAAFTRFGELLTQAFKL